MIGELNLFGVFIPVLLAWTIITAVLFLPLTRLLDWLGFYRLVWHRPLANLAMFILLLAALAAILPQWFV